MPAAAPTRFQSLFCWSFRVSQLASQKNRPGPWAGATCLARRPRPAAWHFPVVPRPSARLAIARPRPWAQAGRVSLWGAPRSTRACPRAVIDIVRVSLPGCHPFLAGANAPRIQVRIKMVGLERHAPCRNRVPLPPTQPPPAHARPTQHAWRCSCSPPPRLRRLRRLHSQRDRCPPARPPVLLRAPR